ncbi:MAG: hypothetical protein PF795_03395, partial [Kiritimatiellae bacterium]|nr:hypothetical protein [Kiritimatiellia bacterium]
MRTKPNSPLLKTTFLLAFAVGTIFAAAPAPAQEVKALFVGNSYCDFNALNKQVEAMMKSDGDDALFKRETQGGFSWRKHWEGGQAQRRIENEEDWTYVVLQNHSRSALDQRAEFDEYGQKFIDLVKKSGAEPILYMTWARKNLPEDQAVITEAYSSLGNRNGIKVAPVGIAFEAWIKDNPSIPLHIHDNSHPSSEGSYLAACVIYATLTGESPVGAPNVIEGKNWVTKGDHLAFLGPAIATQLQETAWNVVQNYSPEQYASDTPLQPKKAEAPHTGSDVTPVQPSGSDIKINFGGTKEPGWNKVGPEEMQTPMALVNADDQPSAYSLKVTDGFESYENPKVVTEPLEGEAIDFEGAKSATLFVNREKENPRAEVQLNLDSAKTYQFRIWASRAAGGKRWARYTVAGENEVKQFLAAGGDYGTSGNPNKVLTFSHIQPDADGTVTLSLDFPKEGDPEFNVGPYVYLTGLIIAEHTGSAGSTDAPAPQTSSEPAAAPAGAAAVAPSGNASFTGSDVRVNFGG